MTIAPNMAWKTGYDKAMEDMALAFKKRIAELEAENSSLKSKLAEAGWSGIKDPYEKVNDDIKAHESPAPKEEL